MDFIFGADHKGTNRGVGGELWSGGGGSPVGEISQERTLDVRFN